MAERMQEQASSEGEELIRFHNPVESTTASSAYPWYSQRTRSLPDPILRMHNETIDFHLHLAPPPQAHLARTALLHHLAQAAHLLPPHALLIAPFLAARLYLRDAELEVLLLLPRLTPLLAADLQALLAAHLRTPLAALPPTHDHYPLFEFEVVLADQTVVFRMMERGSWEEFFGSVGEINAQVPELKFLFSVLSCMLRQRGLQTAIRPHLLFALLAVFYHERRKHKHRTLTENLIKFVEYYGAGPFAERRINYLGRGRYELQSEGPFALWVDQQTNAANPRLRDFFALLKNRYRLLSNYNFLGEQSILALLVNPSGGEFEYL